MTGHAGFPPGFPPIRPPTRETVIDEAITALARHYGVTEAHIREDLADMANAGHRSRDLLENAAMSLIVALDKLTRYGFDDAAVSAAEEIEDL